MFSSILEVFLTYWICMTWSLGNGLSQYLRENWDQGFTTQKWPTSEKYANLHTLYLVRAHLLNITASMQRGTEVIGLWHCWSVAEAQAALKVAFWVRHRISVGSRSVSWYMIKHNEPTTNNTGRWHCTQILGDSRSFTLTTSNQAKQSISTKAKHKLYRTAVHMFNFLINLDFFWNTVDY